MEAEHEETDVLYEHSDQTKEKARWHRYQGVAPLWRKVQDICCSKIDHNIFRATWQHLLLCTDEVDDDGAKYEAIEEHDGLEASVAEEGADDAEDEVEGAYCGSVWIVGPNNFEVVLKYWEHLSIQHPRNEETKIIRGWI